MEFVAFLFMAPLDEEKFSGYTRGENRLGQIKRGGLKASSREPLRAIKPPSIIVMGFGSCITKYKEEKLVITKMK